MKKSRKFLQIKRRGSKLLSTYASSFCSYSSLCLIFIFVLFLLIFFLKDNFTQDPKVLQCSITIEELRDEIKKGRAFNLDIDGVSYLRFKPNTKTWWISEVKRKERND